MGHFLATSFGLSCTVAMLSFCAGFRCSRTALKPSNVVARVSWRRSRWTWPNPSGCVEHHDWPWPRFAASPREFGEAMGYALGCEGVIFASTVELVCVPSENGFKLRYTLEE